MSISEDAIFLNYKELQNHLLAKLEQYENIIKVSAIDMITIIEKDLDTSQIKRILLTESEDIQEGIIQKDTFDDYLEGTIDALERYSNANDFTNKSYEYIIKIWVKVDNHVEWLIYSLEYPDFEVMKDDLKNNL